MRFPGRTFIIALVFLNGCASMRVHKEDERLGRYRFNYAIDADPSCGLIQAFDDGSQTLAQFSEDSPVRMQKISAKKGGSNLPLHVLTAGRFITIKDVSDSIDLKFDSARKADKCKWASIFLIHSTKASK